MKKLLIILLLLPAFVLAQTAKEYVEQADKIFETGKKYGYNKEYEGAMALYAKAIAADDTYIEAYRKRAHAMQVGSIFRTPSLDRHALIADYTSIINLSPGDIDAYQKRAMEKYNVKDLKGSREDYEQLIVIDHSNASKYYSAIAEIYMATHDYVDAEKNYTLNIATGGGNFAGRSRARDFMGNYQSALEDYLESITSRKEADHGYLRLGYLYTKVGNYKQAIDSYTKAITMMSGTIEKGQLYDSEFKVTNPYEQRAEVEILAGDYKNAMADYNTAIKFNLMPVLYNGRAVLKNKIGDKAGACTDWNKAYEIAAKALIEWKTNDSLREVHRHDPIQIINASNRNDTVDTLGFSAVILNIKKYCK